MSKCLILMVCVGLLVSGCRTPPLPAIDDYVAEVVAHPIDVAQAPIRKPVDVRPAAGGTAPVAAPKPRDDGPAIDAAPAPAAADSDPRRAGWPRIAARHCHPNVRYRARPPAPDAKGGSIG